MKASTAGLTSGMRTALPSTNSGSFSPFLRLCGAKYFSAVWRAVARAASKVSRLWSAERSRRVSSSALSTSYSSKARLRESSRVSVMTALLMLRHRRSRLRVSGCAAVYAAHGSAGTAIDGIDEAESEQSQGQLIRRRALFAQGQDVFGPVALAGEPGEVHGERRVVPAPGEPGTVVDQAQAAQGFDQRQLARVEVVELVVALDQFCQLALALVPFAGQHHP